MMMMNDGEVWVFAEQEDGIIADVVFELLGKGRELADALGVKLAAVLCGNGVEKLAADLAARGADRIYLAAHSSLARYQTSSYSKVLLSAVREYCPRIFLFGATAIGRDIAPSISSSLKCGLTADCTGLDVGSYTDQVTKEVFEGTLLQTRPAFGGNIIATIVSPRAFPQMATVREGVMHSLPADISRKAEVVHCATDMLDGFTLPSEIIEVVKKAKSGNLKNARIIVAGGAGVGSKENFKLLRELANVLGGEVGGSRAACDLGYVPPECQIGQTGLTVRPALYIACGISGAVQHVSGMKDSAKIIAVNTDASAPIFNVAHYGIVGDLKRVIPMMIKALR